MLMHDIVSIVRRKGELPWLSRVFVRNSNRIVSLSNIVLESATGSERW